MKKHISAPTKHASQRYLVTHENYGMKIMGNVFRLNTAVTSFMINFYQTIIFSNKKKYFLS